MIILSSPLARHVAVYGIIMASQQIPLPQFERDRALRQDVFPAELRILVRPLVFHRPTKKGDGALVLLRRNPILKVPILLEKYRLALLKR